MLNQERRVNIRAKFMLHFKEQVDNKKKKNNNNNNNDHKVRKSAETFKNRKEELYAFEQQTDEKKIELEGRLEAVSEKIDTYSKLRKSRNKLDE